MCIIFFRHSITLHEFARHVNDVENEMGVRGSPGWVSDHDDAEGDMEEERLMEEDMPDMAAVPTRTQDCLISRRRISGV